MIEFPRVPDDVKAAKFHYLLADTGGTWRCDACGKSFESREAIPGGPCEAHAALMFSYCTEFLNAIKGVIKTDKEKVTPVTGPDAGRRIKVRIYPTEKLVRILAAVYSVDAELFEALDFEAKNRVMVAGISGKKAWE